MVIVRIWTEELIDRRHLGASDKGLCFALGGLLLLQLHTHVHTADSPISRGFAGGHWMLVPVAFCKLPWGKGKGLQHSRDQMDKQKKSFSIRASCTAGLQP